MVALQNLASRLQAPMLPLAWWLYRTLLAGYKHQCCLLYGGFTEPYQQVTLWVVLQPTHIKLYHSNHSSWYYVSVNFNSFSLKLMVQMMSMKSSLWTRFILRLKHFVRNSRNLQNLLEQERAMVKGSKHMNYYCRQAVVQLVGDLLVYFNVCLVYLLIIVFLFQFQVIIVIIIIL